MLVWASSLGLTVSIFFLFSRWLSTINFSWTKGASNCRSNNDINLMTATFDCCWGCFSSHPRSKKNIYDFNLFSLASNWRWYSVHSPKSIFIVSSTSNKQQRDRKRYFRQKKVVFPHQHLFGHIQQETKLKCLCSLLRIKTILSLPFQGMETRHNFPHRKQNQTLCHFVFNKLI